MLHLLLNIVPFMQASWDAGFYAIDRKAVETYIVTYLESKGIA